MFDQHRSAWFQIDVDGIGNCDRNTRIWRFWPASASRFHFWQPHNSQPRCQPRLHDWCTTGIAFASNRIPTTWKLHTLKYANAHNQLSVTEVRGFRTISSFSGNNPPICRPSPQSMNRYPSVWVNISSEPFRIVRYSSCLFSSCTPPVLSS